jgi:Holliday junction resolvasome RuvABC DNA-binding subunit
MEKTMKDENKKTSQELLADLKDTLLTHGSSFEVSRDISRVIEKRVEEKIYEANAHAKLGYHVSEVMKFFKGLK